MHALLVDAGTGNLHSVYNALISSGFDIRLTSDPADLAKPVRVILPGVGAFGKFMEGLEYRGLANAICQSARRGDPILGICVGMQALFEVSEEQGHYPGLGLLPGKVHRFKATSERKVPHTGWNQIWPGHSSSLLQGIDPGAYAYFNHSFFCAPADPQDVLAVTDYGKQFTSAIQHGQLVAVQFHPEKSQKVGLQILRNFMTL